MRCGNRSKSIVVSLDGAQEETPILQEVSSDFDPLPCTEVEDRGLEPLTFWLPARRSPN